MSKITFIVIFNDIPSGYLSQSQTNRYWDKFLSSDSKNEAMSAVYIALPLTKRSRLDTGLREGSESSESPKLICRDDGDD